MCNSRRYVTYDDIRRGAYPASGADSRYRHSVECPLMLFGKSIAGCLKVRWTDGDIMWYENCCEGVWKRS